MLSIIPSLIQKDFRSYCLRAELIKWYQKRILRKTFGIWNFKRPFNLTLCDDHSALSSLDRLFECDEPVMVCRWGSTELDIVYECLKIANGIKNGLTKSFMERTGFECGIFPANDTTYVNFASLCLEAFASCDVLGVWGSNRTYPTEEYVIRKYTPNIDLIPFDYVSPLGKSRPWSRFLEGKTVVVVHPFVQSIETQYAKRKLLFKDSRILPEFKLVLIKAVLSNVAEKVEYTDWFAALESMKNQLDAINFDYLIVGSGAYGMPLAAYAKSLGKKAIHLGGATQLLFGIRGNRWDSLDGYYDQIGANLEHWIRPNKSETPKMHQKLENATYW